MSQFTTATCHIVGISPLTFSRKHDDPFLKGEKHDDYDDRTWRSKLTVSTDGKSVVLNAFGVKQCITSAAKYTKRKIEGMGNSTWTAKFNSGIVLMDPPSLGIDPKSVTCIPVSVNADGVRGSGKRVTRRFPFIAPGWETTFDVIILDEIITEDIFGEMLNTAGMFIGLGQYRPENGGLNGRFRVQKVKWHDARLLMAA